MHLFALQLGETKLHLKEANSDRESLYGQTKSVRKNNKQTATTLNINIILWSHAVDREDGEPKDEDCEDERGNDKTL